MGHLAPSQPVKGLTLAPGLTLPLDFASEGLVVIGVRGSGKSNTEVRFAELLYGAEVPFVAIDPKGDWYGIRMDGSERGLSVPVFGGLFGDFPLDERLGARIADLLVDHNISAVLDVSRMTHAARSRFLTDFFRHLMDRHQLEPHVRTVIFEEAHRYIPQNVKGDQAALKEAASAVLLEGRSFGLGCWACTQRPARLHNDVLEEVDTALIFRIGVTATADLKRVRDWVKHEDLGDEIGASLTKLKAGEAWVLSPVSLGIVKRVQMDRRCTFDSGATPVVGAGALKRRQATMADIDAGAIKEALADAIDKAKENDPTDLRRRLSTAEARVKELEAWTPPPPPAPIVVSVPNSVLEARDRAVERLGAAVQAVHELSSSIDSADTPAAKGSGSAPALTVVPRPARLPVPRPSRMMEPEPEARAAGSAPLGRRERLILTVLAQFPQGRSHRQIALLTGYSAKASTIGAGLSQLRKAGYVGAGSPIRITAEGFGALGEVEELPQGDALLQHWLSELGKRERSILEHMVEVWPAETSHAEVARVTGYSPEASTIGAGMSKLRGLELVDGWRAHPDFMEAIGR